MITDFSIQSLRARCPNIAEGVPLAPLCSYKTGGPARCFLVVQSESELVRAITTCLSLAIPVHLLGGGANTLFSDHGFDGLVVQLGEGFDLIEWVPADRAVGMRVGGAVRLQRLLREATERGASGIECLAGVPGTLGGAVAMNAGSGDWLGHYVDSVRILTSQGICVERDRPAMEFSYRHSSIAPGETVLSALLSFDLAPASSIAQLVRDRLDRRAASQPVDLPCAGSMFKNPSGDFAGRLIEAAGLKGRRCGGAQISTKHSNFFVNTGGAASADVLELLIQAQDAVLARSGVLLIPEIRLIGNFQGREHALRH